MPLLRNPRTQTIVDVGTARAAVLRSRGYTDVVEPAAQPAVLADAARVFLADAGLTPPATADKPGDIVIGADGVISKRNADGSIAAHLTVALLDTTPIVDRLQATAPALAAGATADQSVGEAPFAGVVTSVTYTPEANVTGDTTNTRTLTLVNKGADGNGTTVIATLALITGVNLTDFNETPLTRSVVANATTVAAGDVLAFASTHAADGVADPGGLVQVEITRS